MDLSQFFNLGITKQQAKLGIDKLMQCGVTLPQNILDAYNLRKQRKELDFFINEANGSKILVESLFSMIFSKIKSN